MAVADNSNHRNRHPQRNQPVRKIENEAANQHIGQRPYRYKVNQRRDEGKTSNTEYQYC